MTGIQGLSSGNNSVVWHFPGSSFSAVFSGQGLLPVSCYRHPSCWLYEGLSLISGKRYDRNGRVYRLRKYAALNNHLPGGIYIVKINGSEVRKFVKQ